MSSSQVTDSRNNSKQSKRRQNRNASHLTHTSITEPPSFDKLQAGLTQKNYTSELREDKAVAFLKNANGYDVTKLRKAEYMQHLSDEEQRHVESMLNFDKLMMFRKQSIVEQFKPLDMYYDQQHAKFDTEDIDLIDKAERYMDEILNHKIAKKHERYETASEILKLIKVIDIAKRRGGLDAINEKNFKPSWQLTEAEKEQKKPFWERTYQVTQEPFRFEKKFVNDYMKRVDFLIKDNETAYFDYKKRALFPKVSDNSQKYLQEKGEEGKEMGFVEYHEKQLRDLYMTFVDICKQMRDDSYKTRGMSLKQLDFFVKLYVKLKDLVPYMMTKRTGGNEEDGTAPANISDILELPHMEKIKNRMSETVKESTMNLSQRGGGALTTMTRKPTEMSVTREDADQNSGAADHEREQNNLRSKSQLHSFPAKKDKVNDHKINRRAISKQPSSTLRSEQSQSGNFFFTKLQNSSNVTLPGVNMNSPRRDLSKERYKIGKIHQKSTGVLPFVGVSPRINISQQDEEAKQIYGDPSFANITIDPTMMNVKDMYDVSSRHQESSLSRNTRMPKTTRNHSSIGIPSVKKALMTIKDQTKLKLPQRLRLEAQSSLDAYGREANQNVNFQTRTDFLKKQSDILQLETQSTIKPRQGLRNRAREFKTDGRSPSFSHVKSKVSLISKPSKAPTMKIRMKGQLEIKEGKQLILAHHKDFLSLINNCNNTTKALGSKNMLKPIDCELLRVEREQMKLTEAYRIIEDQGDITDLVFSNRLFMYKNDLVDQHREEVRQLKDEYNQYMADTTRPAAKLEMKQKASKNLVRQTKFIKI